MNINESTVEMFYGCQICQNCIQLCLGKFSFITNISVKAHTFHITYIDKISFKISMSDDSKLTCTPFYYTKHVILFIVVTLHYGIIRINERQCF